MAEISLDEWIEEAIDNAGVDRFAQAMKYKLAVKRFEGKSGWYDLAACSAEDLSQQLLKYVERGDPVDVANIAMFLWCRGERIIVVSQDDDEEQDDG